MINCPSTTKGNNDKGKHFAGKWKINKARDCRGKVSQRRPKLGFWGWQYKASFQVKVNVFLLKEWAHYWQTHDDKKSLARRDTFVYFQSILGWTENCSKLWRVVLSCIIDANIKRTRLGLWTNLTALRAFRSWIYFLLNDVYGSFGVLLRSLQTPCFVCNESSGCRSVKI